MLKHLAARSVFNESNTMLEQQTINIENFPINGYLFSDSDLANFTHDIIASDIYCK